MDVKLMNGIKPPEMRKKDTNFNENGFKKAYEMK